MLEQFPRHNAYYHRLFCAYSWSEFPSGLDGRCRNHRSKTLGEISRHSSCIDIDPIWRTNRQPIRFLTLCALCYQQCPSPHSCIVCLPHFETCRDRPRLTYPFVASTALGCILGFFYLDDWESSMGLGCFLSFLSIECEGGGTAVIYGGDIVAGASLFSLSLSLLLKDGGSLEKLLIDPAFSNVMVCRSVNALAFLIDFLPVILETLLEIA